jgi:hypothetical protein
VAWNGELSLRRWTIHKDLQLCESTILFARTIPSPA